MPRIIRFPDGGWAGNVGQELASLADIIPTICELAGASTHDGVVHGRSLLDLLENRTPWRDAVVVESDGLNGSPVTMRTYAAAGFADRRVE